MINPFSLLGLSFKFALLTFTAEAERFDFFSNERLTASISSSSTAVFDSLLDDSLICWAIKSGISLIVFLFSVGSVVGAALIFFEALRFAVEFCSISSERRRAASRAAMSAFDGRPRLRLGASTTSVCCVSAASSATASFAFSAVAGSATSDAGSSASTVAGSAGAGSETTGDSIFWCERSVENMWSASFFLIMRVLFRGVAGVSLLAELSA